MKITSVASLEISEKELNSVGYFKVKMRNDGDWCVMDMASDGVNNAREIQINGVSFVPVKRD